MKIAIWHNLPSGGAKRVLYEQVRGLVARGHHVEAWCPPFADRAYLPLAEMISEHVVAAYSVSFERKYKGDVLDAYFGDIGFVNDKVAALQEHCRACAQEMNAGNFDVLFANECMFLAAPAIGKFATLPRLLYLHEPYRALYEAAPRLPWLALPPPRRFWWSPNYLKWLARDFARTYSLRLQMRAEQENAAAFDTLLVNSYFSRESILKAYGQAARVCYPGVDAQFFRPLSLERERIVLGLGSFTFGKGIDRALRAVGAVPAAQRPPLVWIGNLSHAHVLSEYETLAQTLDVEFTPLHSLEQSTVIEWLNRAALLIYPPRLEPLGLAALEASACETPVVGIAEGGVRETVRDEYNGLLVADDSPDALARAILRVFDNPTLARDLGKNGRAEILARWNWSDATTRLENELEQTRRT